MVLFIASCVDTNQRSDAYGNFESIAVNFSADAQGRILEFNVEEGQVLEKGDFLGFIDTVSLSLKKDQLQTSLVAVKSGINNINAQINVQNQQKENLLIDKERIERLLKNGAATQKQLDDIEGAIRVIEKQEEALNTQKTVILDEAATVRVQIAQVDDNIRKCYIVNPVKGTVLTKFVEENEMATPGKPLYKIADLSKLFIYK